MILLALACVTETGNPELDVALRPTATSSDSKVAAAPLWQVSGAWVLIDDVRLVEGDDCDAVGEVEHDAEGPFETDLLADPPLTVHIPAVATDYCRLRVRLDPADGVADAPAELDDHSVLVEGSRGGVPFVARSRRNFEVDLRSRSEPFPLAEGAADLLLAFDVGAWLGDLGELAPGDDGVIRIDEDHDEALDRFEAAVESAMSLHDDVDGDGSLDDDDGTLAD